MNIIREKRVGKFSCQTFLKEDTGVAFVETAAVLPLLVLILTGIFEYANYALVNNKLVRAAGVIGDMVARQNLSRTSLIAIMQSANKIIQPFNNTVQPQVVVSLVYNSKFSTDTAKMVIAWQQQINGGASQLGTPGSLPKNLPNNITAINDQSLIVTEVFFNYVPRVFSSMFGATPLYKVSVYTPRSTNMNTLLGE